MPDDAEARAGLPPRLVVATTNRGKLREMAEILAADGCEVLGLAAVGLDAGAWHVEEDGLTFADNARLKAGALADRAGLPALGDDSGLEVAALGGQPGVRSARYAGDGASDAANVELLLRKLADVPDGERQAAFRCALALVWPGGRRLEAEGRCDGVIARAPRGSGGFGYDPVFVDPASGLTFAELSAAAKNAFSHRRRGLDALRRAAARLKG